MAAEISSLTTNSCVTRRETTVSTEISGELVALDIRHGVCYGLNRIGTRIWQLLDSPRSTAQIVDTLVTEYDVSRDMCMEQTLGLLGDLRAAGLIKSCAGEVAGGQAHVSP